MARKSEDEVEDTVANVDEETEAEDPKKSKKDKSQKAILVPQVVSVSEMFNIINQKLDMCLALLQQKK